MKDLNYIKRNLIEDLSKPIFKNSKEVEKLKHKIEYKKSNTAMINFLKKEMKEDHGNIFNNAVIFSLFNRALNNIR